MRKGKPNEEIFVGQEYIGDVRMVNHMVERSMKDVKDVYVKILHGYKHCDMPFY